MPSLLNLKFRYRKVPCNPTAAHPDRTFIWTPRIEIRLARNQLTTHPFDALLDTGADYCLFPFDAAKAIGIMPVENDRPVQFHGIGGMQVTAYFHPVTVVLGGHEIPCEAGFVDNPKQAPLLGREGFLNRFAVTFDPIRNEIVFKSR